MGFYDVTETLQQIASAQQWVDYNKRFQKAFSAIVMSISLSQLYLITSCEEDAAWVWTALKNHFERGTLLNKLKNQYFRMEMKDGTSMKQEYEKIDQQVNSCWCRDSPWKLTLQLFHTSYCCGGQSCYQSELCPTVAYQWGTKNERKWHTTFVFGQQGRH